MEIKRQLHQYKFESSITLPSAMCSMICVLNKTLQYYQNILAPFDIQ